MFLIPGLHARKHEQVRRVDFRGLEHIEACRAEGKGGIFMTAHMGSWELAGVAIGMLGVPVTAAVLKHTDPRIDEIFADIRKRGQIEEVPVGGAFAEAGGGRGTGAGSSRLVSDRDVKGSGMKVRVLRRGNDPAHRARQACCPHGRMDPPRDRPTGRVTTGSSIEIRPPIIPQPGETEEELMAPLRAGARGHDPRAPRPVVVVLQPCGARPAVRCGGST